MKEIYVANIIGKTGAPATIKIVAVQTMPPDSKAEVINVGTDTAVELIFKLPVGEGFRIQKTYTSVADMDAGFQTDNVPLYGFVLIDTGDVEDEENARLYIKGEHAYEFLTDLSGAQGIKGEQGIQGVQGEKGESVSEIVYVETTDSGHVFRAILSDGTDAGTFTIPIKEITADKVILQDDLLLAGDYIQVGNVSKGTESATVTYPAKGKSVAQVLQEIFTKRLQPKITKQPSVYGFTFNMAGRSVEVGTHYDSFTVGTLNLETGSYTYDSETGVMASGYSIKRIVNGAETEMSTAGSVTDSNDGAGFTVGDGSTIAYKGSITYTQGNIATDNLGDPSDPPVCIEAGTANYTTSQLMGYRNYFYGALSTADPPHGSGITSAIVRGLTKSNRAYSAGTVTLTVPVGATGIYIACIATRTGVVKVINKTALNADVTATFVKQSGVAVEGLNGYTAANYNVWYYIPAVPYENTAELEITLG